MENKFEPNTYFYLYSQINFNLNILVFVLGPKKYVLITMYFVQVCVENIKDFTSCFLFSLETQHTIG